MKKYVTIVNAIELMERMAGGRRVKGVLFKDKATGAIIFQAYNCTGRKRWPDRLIRYLEHGWVKESKENVKVYESIPKIIGTVKVMSALDREIGEAKNALMVREIIDRV